MTYTIEPYSALCELKEFQINGVDADYYDFGEKYDSDSANAEPYGCGNMIFDRYIEPREGILEKYHINEIEYDTICNKLEEALSFGCCGWCV